LARRAELQFLSFQFVSFSPAGVCAFEFISRQTEMEAAMDEPLCPICQDHVLQLLPDARPSDIMMKII
jgi:hypothetical protein